jgi:hypothetical protein
VNSPFCVFFRFPPDFGGLEQLILKKGQLKFFEFADESFCQAQVPMLRRACVINATAPSRHAPRRVKRKVSAVGRKDRRTKITSAGRKTASVSKTGANAIPAIGAKRSLQPKNRYKKCSKRKRLIMKM